MKSVQNKPFVKHHQKEEKRQQELRVGQTAGWLRDGWVIEDTTPCHNRHTPQAQCIWGAWLGSRAVADSRGVTLSHALSLEIYNADFMCGVNSFIIS